MTIVVAAIYGNKSIMAADTLVVHGDKKVQNLKNFPKLIKFPKFIVGFSGDCSIFPVLKELASDSSYLKKAYLRMRSLKDATQFGRDVYEGLKGNIECSPSFDKEKDGAELAEIVILTRTSIYKIDPFMFASEYTKFATTGSGEDIAIGMMTYAYKRLNSEDELKQLIEESVILACEGNTQCSLPMQLIELED